jgi:hypothetical protein
VITTEGNKAMIERRALIATSIATILAHPLDPDSFCPSCGVPWTVDPAKPGDVCDGLHCETRDCLANRAWLELLDERRFDPARAEP